MSAYDTYARNLDPTPRVRKISGPFSPNEALKTVADALAFREERRLDPADVRLAHNYVTYERAETEEEVQKRVTSAEAAQRTHLARIREMHEEYIARGLYEHPNPPGVT